MGAGITVRGRRLLCEGDDVTAELNRVFGHPGTQPLIDAQGQAQAFYDVAHGTSTQPAGRWDDLHKAYLDAGVADSPNWSHYLTTLGAANIIMIAQARYDGLTAHHGRGKRMQTGTHNPGS